MTPDQIASDVERGIAIKKEIAALTAELKEIETRLTLAGQHGQQVPLQNENLEGRQFIARSSRHVLPVRFESDLIAASFDDGSTMHKELKQLLGDLFPKFFKRSTKFERVQKEGEQFRKVARGLLEPDTFAKVVRAATARDKNAIAKSRTVIAWDDAKEAAPTA